MSEYPADKVDALPHCIQCLGLLRDMDERFFLNNEGPYCRQCLECGVRFGGVTVKLGPMVFMGQGYLPGGKL